MQTAKIFMMSEQKFEFLIKTRKIPETFKNHFCFLLGSNYSISDFMGLILNIDKESPQVNKKNYMCNSNIGDVCLFFVGVLLGRYSSALAAKTGEDFIEKLKEKFVYPVTYLFKKYTEFDSANIPQMSNSILFVPSYSTPRNVKEDPSVIKTFYDDDSCYYDSSISSSLDFEVKSEDSYLKAAKERYRTENQDQNLISNFQTPLKKTIQGGFKPYKINESAEKYDPNIEKCLAGRRGFKPRRYI
jgi:hypothetical protein